MQDLAVETALAEKSPIGWAAPVYKQVLDDFRTLSDALAPVITRKSGSEMRLELLGGGVIEFWSLDKPGSIRGKKYRRFIVNESAEVKDLIYIRNFIIAPTLIDLQGDEYHAGTPKGMNGFFHLYNMSGDDWARWQMPSYSNPHIPKSELDGLRETMPERAFSQEILAKFLEGGGGVFRNVREAATSEPLDRGEDGRQYVIGVDWGRSYDATVFKCFDIEARCEVASDRMTNTDYASQRTRLKAMSDRFNKATILAEANSIGQPNIEALQIMGLAVQSFTTTNATKAQIVQGLELAFERGEIQILDDEITINELMAYQSERLPSGLVRYNAPDGMHDDTVIATALAWSATQNAAVVAWEW
ncbi:MAG: hypothetical protein GY776_03685 [Alteromonas sp.]|nr:hypothetical protein [Alteromonas sp.]